MRLATRTALVALAIGAALFVKTEAHAQVQLFDDVPSLEQLRTILIPESAPSASRRIIINAPKSNSVQPAALSMPQPAVPTTPSLMPVATPPEATTATGSPSASASAEPAPATPEAKPAAVRKQAAAMAPPVAKPGLATDATAVGFRIDFGFNSATVAAESAAYLDKIAELLAQEKKLVITVEGHTDAVGGDDYNLDLSRRRAEAVSRYLVGHGATPGQLIILGKGKSEPLVANPYDARNRRVQFSRVNEGGMS